MKIALWKLGNLEHGIYPNAKAIDKLRNIISKAQEDESEIMNMIWGPELEVQIINVDANVILAADEETKDFKLVLIEENKND